MKMEGLFMSRVMVAVSGCWVWQGSMRPDGYGRLQVDGVRDYAHRVSFRLYRGAIRDGLQIDHLCRNPSCVNPAHLEAVTPRVNTLRGVSPAAKAAASSRCPRGHEKTEENMYVRPSGKRQCRICAALNASKCHMATWAIPEARERRKRMQAENARRRYAARRGTWIDHVERDLRAALPEGW